MMMKKFLSLLLAVSFVVSVFPLSATAAVHEHNDAVTVDLCAVTETGEYENSEKYTVYYMMLERAFDEESLSDLTRYLESVPEEKTAFIITNGVISDDADNVMILLHILDMHGGVLVSKNEKTSDGIVYEGGHIHYGGASYIIGFTYITLSSTACTFNAYLTDDGIEYDIHSHYHTHEVHDHAHMNDDGEAVECQHANTSVINSKEASCTEVGYTGDVYCNDCSTVIENGEEIPEKGHDYKDFKTKQPNCMENGYIDEKCDVCGEINRKEILYSTGTEHDWGTEVITKAPTCTEKGEKTRECLVCHVKEKADIDALGHDIETTVVPATCTEDGYTLHKCTRDGCTYEEKTDVVASGGHQYKDFKTKQPNCLENGYIDEKCDVCGEINRKEILYSTGTEHDWGEYVITQASTCTEKGEKTRECLVCHMKEKTAIDALGHIIEINVVPATCTEDGYTLHKCVRDGCAYEEKTNIVTSGGHNYVVVREKAVTCLDDGYTDYECSKCGDFYRVEYETTGTEHDFGEEFVSKEPTCTAPGKKSKKCSVCGISVEAGTIDALGHDYKTTVVPATCTEEGYTLYECKREGCGHVYKDNVISALGHKWDAWYADADFHAKKCVVCGEIDTKVPHDYTDGTCECGYGCEHTWGDWISDANGHYRICSKCSENSGKTAHNYVNSVCTDCGYTCTHTWGEWSTVVPNTCTEDGTEERTCYSCGAVETRATDKLGHSYEVTVTKPTCTEGGYTTYKCSACGDTYTSDELPAAGHSFSEWVVINDSACTEKGSKKRTCVSCGEVENAEIPEKGHDYEETVTPPTCTEGGYTTYICTVCGDTYTANELPAAGHTFNEWITNADTHTARCSVCGVVGTPEAHTYEGGKCTVCEYACLHSDTTLTGYVAATCTSTGYTGDTYCNVCGELVEKGTDISMTSHYWGEWKHNESEHYKVCTLCGMEVDRGAHIYSETNCVICGYGCEHGETEIRDAKEPTCTAEGYTGDTYCTACGVEIKRGEKIAMLDHTFGAWEYDGANGHFKTCVNCPATTDIEAHTYTNGKCTVCGYTCSHRFGEWVTVNDSTCTENGTKKRVCEICAIEETGVINAKGHDYRAVVTPPTCTEKGYTTHSCSRCTASYVDTYVDAKGHVWGDWITVNDSTCTEKGTKKRICSVCAAEEFGEIEAKGHNYIPTVVPPTCTEQGYTIYDCSRCDSVYNDDYVEENGHSWSEWSVTKEPTFFEDGELQRKCTVCGAIEKKAIPMNEDTTPPVATIVIGDYTWNAFKNDVAFNTFFNEIISVTITAEDVGTSAGDTSGVMSIQYYQSVNAYTKDQLKNINGWKSIKNVDKGGSFPIATDGEYIVYVRVTDNVGNVEYYSTDGIVIDRVIPSITGNGIGEHDSNLSFCGNVTLTITDDYLKNVYINGVSQEFTGRSCVLTLEPKTEKYQIVVEDAAGNTRVIVISVNGEHSAGAAPTCTEPQVCQICGEVIQDAVGHSWRNWVVTKEATAKEYGEEMRQCRRCAATETRQTPKLDFPTQFTSKVYTYSPTEAIVTGVATSTTVEKFLSNMDNREYIRVFGIDTKEITDKSQLITTGMKIKLMENATSYSAEAAIVIKGDVDCNGISDITDVVTTNLHSLSQLTLVGATLEAADVNNDGIIDITDVVQMNLTNLGLM